MLRGCVLGIALLAACSGDHGVYLVITSSQQLSKVELFIGDQPISTSVCGPFAAPCMVSPQRASGSASVAYPADVYTQSLSEAVYENFDGTHLTYHVDPGDSPHTASALLVVGYDGQGNVVADKVMYNVEIKSSPVEIRVTLDKANDLDGDPALERVAVWRRATDTDGTQSACALVRHTDPARDNDYFAPSDDYDCDGALMSGSAQECNNNTDLTWCAVVQRGEVKEATCLTSGDSGACRLGAPPCVDGDKNGSCPRPTNGASCIPTSEVGCTDQTICHALSQAQPPCNTLDSTCLGSVASAAPHASCIMTLTPSGTCAVHVDAKAPSFALVLGARTCNSLQIAPIAMPFTAGGSASGYTLKNVVGCAGDLQFTAGNTPVPIFLVFDVSAPTGNQTIVLPMVPETASNTACPSMNTNCTADSLGQPITCP